MKPYSIDISHTATKNIQGAVVYIAQDSCQNAASFVAGVYRVIDALEYFPGTGVAFGNIYRVKIYEHHYIIYRIDEQDRTVYIVNFVNVKNYKAYKKYL